MQRRRHHSIDIAYGASYGLVDDEATCDDPNVTPLDHIHMVAWVRDLNGGLPTAL